MNVVQLDRLRASEYRGAHDGFMLEYDDQFAEIPVMSHASLPISNSLELPLIMHAFYIPIQI